MRLQEQAKELAREEREKRKDGTFTNEELKSSIVSAKTEWALNFNIGAMPLTESFAPIAKQKVARSSLDLPEDGLVFCSLNQTLKFEPVIFDLWMRLLEGVAGSVLWLLEANALAEDNLNREAAARGIDPARVVFAGRIPKDEHLARLECADLALDTRIYNGHTSTSDALWAGLPVLTLKGRHFASRVSASILAAAGIPELITECLEDYEALALRLAGAPEESE